MNLQSWMQRVILGVGLAVVTSGCSIPPESSNSDVGHTAFLTYEGKQERWPTAEGALVARDYAPPIYQGLPPKPYTILGRIVNTELNIVGHGISQGLWTDQHRRGRVCVQARLHGADAVLLTTDPKIIAALQVKTGSEGRMERPLYDFDGAVIAIKWTQ